MRELAYDVEDTVDEFMHRVDDAHGVAGPPNNHGSGTLLGFVSRVAQLMRTAWMRLRLANELKGLMAHAYYKYGEDIYVPPYPRINTLYTDAPDLVGVGVEGGGIRNVAACFGAMARGRRERWRKKKNKRGQFMRGW